MTKYQADSTLFLYTKSMPELYPNLSGILNQSLFVPLEKAAGITPAALLFICYDNPVFN